MRRIFHGIKKKKYWNLTGVLRISNYTMNSKKFNPTIFQIFKFSLDFILSLITYFYVLYHFNYLKKDIFTRFIGYPSSSKAI